MADRLRFGQGERWHKAHGGLSGVDSVYSQQQCCYCARPTKPGTVRLRTARTNDGEWWLVGPNVDMAALEWRDFQDQLDGTFAPTLLPVGPDCLRQHPEWRFAVVPYTAGEQS